MPADATPPHDPGQADPPLPQLPVQPSRQASRHWTRYLLLDLRTLANLMVLAGSAKVAMLVHFGASSAGASRPQAFFRAAVVAAGCVGSFHVLVFVMRSFALRYSEEARRNAAKEKRRS